MRLRIRHNIHETVLLMRAFFRGLAGAGSDVLGRTAQDVRDRMTEEGAPVRRPVQWDSERQRRAFFATNGFGRGIPYRRTHQYRFGWQLQRVQFGHTLTARHPAGAISGTVVGNRWWQSRIHRGRWNYLPTILVQELSRLPAAILERLKVLAGRR